jgi:hypothetical protein
MEEEVMKKERMMGDRRKKGVKEARRRSEEV